MTAALAVAGVILVSLVIYTVSGGADFGGGVWDLLARGPRAQEQRKVIAHAIAPIWEANHVWLILVIVLLFVAFPLAYATVSVVLHIPLFIMLIGIVLRGCAFTFRAYGKPTPGEERLWNAVFAGSSILTPVMLGVILGAVSTGRVRTMASGGVPDFVDAWWAPFPFAVGLFVLVLFAFLAAVYLILETDDEGLQNDFRYRAIGSAVALGATALLAFLVADKAAPELYQGLAHRDWSWVLHLVTGAVAVLAIGSLWARRYRQARVLAISQAALIVIGWGLAQYPYIIVPDLTVENAAAPVSVLIPTLIVLGLGIVVVGPAFWYLYRVFKAR